jgi:regulatory protein
LRERGIAASIAMQTIDGAEFDWLQLARQARAKHFGRALPRMPAERARQMRFLQYKGFPTETIRMALSDAEDEEP